MNENKANNIAYPKYDNYDAIEVSYIKNIPSDYKVKMGVPITFIDKWNPDQFEVIGILAAGEPAKKLGVKYVYSKKSKKK
jgi:hypothetical protein